MAPGRIRDSVHGYIPFTAIERALLDDPVAQRLRYVGQSAAAHLVFPEMRVSRLAHSLGAMHLASRFLVASLANADPDTRESILAGCKALVDRHAGMGVGGDVERTIEGQGLLTGRDERNGDRVAVLLVEQGLRLASLVHDLGHLPFSHDLEQVLKEHFHTHSDTPEAKGQAGILLAQGPGGDAIHERIGYALANSVLKAVFTERFVGTPLSKPAEVALLIARDILHAPPIPELDTDDAHAPVLSWLHSLVAGEIDVDRADYVLRDVRHYGLAAAGYDLDRLVDNLVPLCREDSRIETGVLPQGVTAAEGFFVARFRMYTWAVYHHKAQQAAAGLRVASTELLSAGGPATKTFLADIAAIADETAPAEVLDRFSDYDDAWWIGLLRERLRSGEVAKGVEPWLALFTRRRPGPVSLWKRPSEFPIGDRVGWNSRLPASDDFELQDAWESARLDLRNQGVLVERLPFRPWAAGDDGESILRVPTSADRVVPLTRLTPLVRALAVAWRDELQVFAFAEQENCIEPSEVLDRLEPALRSAEES